MSEIITIKHIKENLYDIIHSGVETQTSVSLPSPDNIYFSGGKTFRDELRWYFEVYIYSPYGAYRERAERLLARLDEWGANCYSHLFTVKPKKNVKIIISASDPSVLSHPWEALNKNGSYLAITNKIERDIPQSSIPHTTEEMAEKKKLNILFVISRPLGEDDVKYLNITRPLTEYIQRENYPVNIDLLRPPTFAEFIRAINKKQYDAILFDCHGDFDHETKVGMLIFEKENGGADSIKADVLKSFLYNKQIPLIIMSACRSAMPSHDDAFTSVAASLIQSGIRNVIAMSYMIHIQGAALFISSFLNNLFQIGDVGTAVTSGRQAMSADDSRSTTTGKHGICDWLIPVLYGEAVTGFALNRRIRKRVKSSLPDGIPAMETSFIGRDKSVLSLERAMRRDEAGILIHGMMGVGKTTLAAYFLRWLEVTNGLGAHTFWFNFENIRSSEYVINELGDKIIGTIYRSLGDGEKMTLLTKAMKEKQYIIVWDNFESASGIAGTAVIPHMPEKDYKELSSLLSLLHSGKSKIIITSRKDEEISENHLYRLNELSGLTGEDLTLYCETVMKSKGISLPDEHIPDYLSLIEKLGGTPLVLQAVLPKLAFMLPSEISNRLYDEMTNGDSEVSHRINTGIAVIFHDIDKRYEPVLRIIGLHERYFNTDSLKSIYKDTGRRKSDRRVDGCVAILAASGFCRPISDTIYEIHPAVREYIASCYPVSDNEEQLFIIDYDDFADEFSGSIRRQRNNEFEFAFSVHLPDFYNAMALAEKHHMIERFFSLANTITLYHYAVGNFTEALRLCDEIIAASEKYETPNQAANAYHEIGDILLQKLDLAEAEKCYRKALDIIHTHWTDHNKEKEIGSVYFQIGRVYEEQHKFDKAIEMYHVSMAIKENAKDRYGMAVIHYQMGRAYEESGAYVTAKKHYRFALKVFRAKSDGHWVANSLYQLGNVEFDLKRFEVSEKYYRESLAIAESVNAGPILASLYRQLGSIAYEFGRLEEAETWYRDSLAITERDGDDYSSAASYGNLGVIADKQNDFPLCVNWHKKASAIFEKYNDEHLLCDSLHQWGLALKDARRFTESERILKKSLTLFEKLKKPHDIAQVYWSLGNIREEQEDFKNARKYCGMAHDIFNELKDEYWQSVVLHEIGMIAAGEGSLREAEDYCRQAMAITKKLKFHENLAASYQQLGKVCILGGKLKAAERWTKKSLAVETSLGDIHGMAQSYYQLGVVAVDKEDYDTAFSMYNEALPLFEQMDDRFNIAECKSELADIYFEKEDLQKSKRFYRAAYDIYEELEDEQSMAECLAGIGLSFQELGNMSSAKKYYTRALPLYEKIGDEENAEIIRNNIKDVSKRYNKRKG